MEIKTESVNYLDRGETVHENILENILLFKIYIWLARKSKYSL